jgi:hypothetical protein
LQGIEHRTYFALYASANKKISFSIWSVKSARVTDTEELKLIQAGLSQHDCEVFISKPKNV